MHLPRRRFLAATAATLSAGIAGCSGMQTDSTPGERSFDQLHQTPTYVADDVDLSMPEAVPVVVAMSNADLLVLPGETGVDAEQAVDWLADERVLALVGDDAEDTWLAWVRSDAYADTFENEGFGDGEPDPDLLVAAAVELRVHRYSRTWSDGPRERDLLRALDETLVDIEQQTPR